MLPGALKVAPNLGFAILLWNWFRFWKLASASRPRLYIVRYRGQGEGTDSVLNPSLLFCNKDHQPRVDSCL